MRIAMLQMNPVVGDLVANCDALMDGYEQAVRLGADCVVSRTGAGCFALKFNFQM